MSTYHEYMAEAPRVHFHRRGVVRARVPHACSDCGSVIKPGTLYMREVGMSDEDRRPMVLTTCHACEFATDRDEDPALARALEVIHRQGHAAPQE